MTEIFYYLSRYYIFILYPIAFFAIVKFLIGKIPKEHHSHWKILIEDFNYSVEEFYNLVKEDLKSQNIPGLTFEHKNISDGFGALNKREYLRIKWRYYNYDLGAMPFGNNNLYISWWLIYANSFDKILIAKIPFIGGWLIKKLYKITYYKVSSASAFMTLTQSSVQKVIKQITEGKGVTLDIDTKPVMNDIFKR